MDISESTKKVMVDEIFTYLGKENRDLIRSFTSEDIKIFNKYKHLIKTRQSYIVKGSRDLLNKFRAYFLKTLAFLHLPYEMSMLKEYVEKLASNDEDSLVRINKDILFLYCHKCSPGVGGTEAWLSASIVDRVANRNRKGLITVILSERSVPIIEGSEEFVIINLGGAAKLKDVEAIAKKVSSDSPSVVQDESSSVIGRMSNGTDYS